MGSHTSKPYNPDIAKVFYRAGYIESQRGIQKICDACKKLGVKEPEYIVHGEDIMVKFRALKSAEAVDGVTEKVTDKVTEKVTDEVTGTLKESDKRILGLLQETPTATYTEIADKLNISRKTVSQRIKLLRDSGLIVRNGSARKGYWELMALSDIRVSKRVIDRVTDEVTQNTVENDKRILEILHETPTATYVEIADKLNVSRKTVSKRIKLLKDSGLIVRIGSDKKGYWKLI